MVGLGFIMIPYDMLELYKSKRDFKISPEPLGKHVIKKKSDKPVFVVQKHNATSMHYDFRLEIDGVLKSWAVPKGPSMDPHDKRLAIETEDHPIDYAAFEGIIPEGQYGAGSVVVWDAGTFENRKEESGKSVSLVHSYKNGQIEISVHGVKLRGGYALIRTDGDDKKKWLLIKMRDEYADAHHNPVVTHPESVVSGKTNEQIEAEQKIDGKTLKKKLKK